MKQFKNFRIYDSLEEYYVHQAQGALYKEYGACRPTFESSLKTLFQYLPNKRSKILDVGCRDGWACEQMIKQGYKNVIGIDVSLPAIQWAQKQKRPVIFGDMHDLEFPDDSFDAIYCSHSLEHAYDPIKALKELVRVLKIGGILFVIVPVKNYLGIYHAFEFYEPDLLKKMIDENFDFETLQYKYFPLTHMGHSEDEVWFIGRLKSKRFKR
jgi:SAM-dependent methyltransferase